MESRPSVLLVRTSVCGEPEPIRVLTLALLLLVVVAATYFAVHAATTRAVENQADVQLNTGRQVFERLLDRELTYS